MNSFSSFVKDLKSSKKIFIAHSLGGFLLNNEILEHLENDYRMFFISPVIGEELIKGEYKKVYEMQNNTKYISIFVAHVC